MGLNDYSNEEFEKLKELVKLLAFFGITEEDLKKLHEVINNPQSNQVHYEMSKEAKMELDKKKEDQTLLTPERFLEMFTQTTEEFYPDGNTNKGKSNNTK